MGDRAATRKAISKKYRRYGNDLGRPFVVALASNRIGLDHLDINEALFGDEVYAFDRTDPSHGHLTRARNGVWIGKDGPRARRLSAVITADGIYPWSIATSNLVVWRNPWADRPFEPDLMNTMHVDLIADRFERTGPETSSADCFGLPHDWPGPEAGFEARG